MNVPRPTPALIVAMLALTVSLSTVSYAAITIPKKSVGAAQLKKNAVVAKKIKPGAVTNRKIKAGAITGDKVANNTLTGAHIDESTLVLPGSAVSIAGFNFEPRSDGTTVAYSGTGRVYKTAGGDWLAARVDLPQGAVITDVKVFVGDTGVANVSAELGRYGPGVPPSYALLAFNATTGTPGDTTLDLTPPLGPLAVVDNTQHTYQVLVHLGATTSETSLIGARVTYSQAPATARKASRMEIAPDGRSLAER